MKHIFVVVDNPGKLADLTKSAKQLFPQVEFEEFKYSNGILGAIFDAKDRILQEPEEYLMIIDMQVPPFTGGRIEADGGLGVLMELQRLEMKCPAIIASSEPIDEEKARGVYAAYKGFVRYRVWMDSKDAMRDVLKEYITSE